jgi:DNA-binding PadR family transcriptional regulator
MLMRRKPGVLLPLELSILDAAFELSRTRVDEFHGYLIASTIGDRDGRRTLTAHGTLYKALDRMKKAGLLESRWEDSEVAASEERPRRRLYRVTAAGEVARAEAERVATATAPPLLRPGEAL